MALTRNIPKEWLEGRKDVKEVIPKAIISFFSRSLEHNIHKQLNNTFDFHLLTTSKMPNIINNTLQFSSCTCSTC